MVWYNVCNIIIHRGREKMIKKHTQLEKVLRKNRKKCYTQIGKEKYDFDRENELLEYKYLCCAKMKRKEWEQCRKKEYAI